MVADSWNRVVEDAEKEDKKYDYNKVLINEVDNASSESGNMDNGVYKSTTVQNRKKNAAKFGFITLGLALSGVIIWLLVLTLIREQQIKSLKENIRNLRSDVNILKKRLLEDDLIDDVKAFEDAVYADSDTDDIPNMETDDDGEKFYINSGLPVSEEEFDDEDMAAESGDWAYDDENRDGSFDLPDNNEEILGEVQEGRLSKEVDLDDEDMIESRKVLRILKDDTSTERERSKREVIDQTKDGVPVLSEPYRLARLMNDSVSPDERTRVYKALESSYRQTPKMLQNWEEKQIQQKRRKYSHPKKYAESQHNSDDQRQGTTPMEYSSETSTQHPSLTYRRSRVMKTDENKGQSFRRVIRYRRPQLRHGENAGESSEAAITPSEYVYLRRRNPHQRHSNVGGRRNLETLDVEVMGGRTTRESHNNIAAHFNGDTSGYIIGYHENYKGNGLLSHPHDTPYTAWKAAPWVGLTAADSRFKLDDNGAVTIAEEGIYLIYAQVLYHDEHDLNSFKVYRSNGAHDETLLQCTTTVHSTTPTKKSSTCFTSAAVYLRAGDKISLKNLGSMRYSIMESGKSFFGFVKLSDIGRA